MITRLLKQMGDNPYTAVYTAVVVTAIVVVETITHWL